MVNLIPLSNTFSVLTQEIDETTEPMDVTMPKAVTLKPPPILVEAQIVESLRELLKKTADNNYSLKQLKDNHIKVQAYATETYSKIVLDLKEKNAKFYTYQLKKDSDTERYTSKNKY